MYHVDGFEYYKLKSWQTNGLKRRVIKKDIPSLILVYINRITPSSSFLNNKLFKRQKDPLPRQNGQCTKTRNKGVTKDSWIRGPT